MISDQIGRINDSTGSSVLSTAVGLAQYLGRAEERKEFNGRHEPLY